MAKKLERENVNEETVYVWNCPECDSFNESCDDPRDEEEAYCKGCEKYFEIGE